MNFVGGVSIGLWLVTLGFILGYTYAVRKLKRRPPAGPPPHPLSQLFEHLKKQGIPFHVEQITPSECQCPACVARRESEKTHRGGNDALH